MAARNTYTRPMTGWWRRHPRFKKYLLREGTAVFVALYAVILLWGLTALALGPSAFAGWLGFLKSPLSIVLHLVILAAVLFHTITWMQIAPKAAPPLRLGTMQAPDKAIVYGGFGAAAVATLVILVLAW
jgi:fumarate reductase subunit C